MNKKNVIYLLIAVILLGGAGLLFARNAHRRPKANPPLPIVCENCGKEFTIKSYDEDPVCPYCGASAKIRRLYFKCVECGHVFVAFEWDPEKELAREPGGEWYPKTECPLEAKCPECGGRTVFVKDVHSLKK